MTTDGIALTQRIARLLQTDPSSLEFLDKVDPASLRLLHDQIVELLFDPAADRLGSLKGAAKVLPPQVTAKIAEKALGPVLSGSAWGSEPAVDEPVPAAEETDHGPTVPEPFIASVDDVPWVEVKAQSRGTQRLSVWEKFLEWSPERMAIYARYDPHMVIEKHGHASDHYVFVISGEITIGERICGPGTHVSLPKGAVFGPLVAGPEGVTMYEIMCGDPRALPADPEEFAALCAERGIEPLPNPAVEWPEWLGKRTDGDSASDAG